MRRLNWDSNHFALEIGRVESMAAIVDEIKVAVSQGIECLYAFVPGADIESIGRAVRLGGRLVDLRLVMDGPATGSTAPGVRRAVAGDASTVEEAAVALAAYSRFSRDAHFAPARVAEMYRIWARQLLAEGVVVVPNGGGGVVAASTDGGTTRLDLVYVAPGAAGRGLGTALIGAALAEAGLPQACVVTQASNIAATRLYESIGLRARSFEAVVHLWLGEVT